MTPLNSHDLTLLQILKSQEICNKALRASAKGCDLFPVQQMPHLACMWITYMQCLRKARNTKTKLDKDEYTAKVLENMHLYDMLPENKEKIKTILERYSDNEPVNIELATNNLTRLVTETVQRSLSRAVIQSAAFESIKKLVERGDELKADIEASDSTAALYINPLMHASKFLKRVYKRPTGVVHFDTVTKGGMSPGDVCLIAGLSGGGKSMTTIQLAGSQLLINKAVGWFTYEQPFDQDLMCRLVAFLTRYSLDKIRNAEFEELPAEVQTKYNSIVETVKDKLIATDFSSTAMLDKTDDLDDGSVYSIRKRVELAKQQGITLNYILVDWLGAAVRKIAAVRNIDIGQVANYRKIADDYLNDLVLLAKEFDVPVIIFHQLKPDIKESPPSRKPASTELQNIHTANNWVQFAITIGKMDDNHRCWFICDKNRTGFPTECVIELDGEHARFKMLHGFSPGRNGQFVDMTEFQDEEVSHGKDVEQSYGIV